MPAGACHVLPRDAAARRLDERGEVEAEPRHLALLLHPLEAAALEHVGVEEVELAEVAAEGVVDARVAQAEGLQRRDLAVLERRLDLLQQEAEAVQELLVVEVRAGEEVGVGGGRARPAGRGRAA